MTRSDHDPGDRRNFPAGYDEEDPYADEDLSSYPDWWREHIQEFRRHGLRPYRPPRFDDGALVPPLVKALEEEIDQVIRLRNPRPSRDDWEILLGRTPVATVARYRHSEGYTVYEIDSDSFERVVREAADQQSP